MSLFLILTAVVMLACIFCSKLSNRIGMPILFAFIILGMLFGIDGIFKIDFENFAFAEQICSIALIFIIFYGGFNTKWKVARTIAPKALLMSSVGTVATAFLTGLFCYFVLKFEFLESLLIGAVVSSTDAASVFSILRSKKLNLKYGVASLLEVESGSNDPWAYTLTIVILSVMKGQSSGASIISTILIQVFSGLFFGVVIALLSTIVIKRISFKTEGFNDIMIMAIALLSYALPTLTGGNGYLSAYIVGIVIGNTEVPDKKAMVNFFDGITVLMQILVFFLLGLLSTPSEIPQILWPSVIIMIFITVVSRPLSTLILLTPFKAGFPEQFIVSWAGLRGATSIIFAIMVRVSGVPEQNDIFHIIFCIVLLSISIQGSLLPFMSRKVNMIDDSESVMKTFNDYNEETELQFICSHIERDDHKWVGERICDITLPPHTRIALIIRDEKKIIPHGDTIVKYGDTVILTATSYYEQIDIALDEIEIDDNHNWCGKKISDIDFSSHILVVMVKRDSGVLIPEGMTEIKPKDILVVVNSE